jgi:hypothetical protein
MVMSAYIRMRMYVYYAYIRRRMYVYLFTYICTHIIKKVYKNPEISKLDRWGVKMQKWVCVYV